MSINNQVVKAMYAANGSNTTFAIPFAFTPGDLGNQLRVSQIDTFGVITYLTTGFTLSPNTLNPTDIVFAIAPLSGLKIVIERYTPVVQGASYSPTGEFPAKTHEKALDRIVMMSQENRDISESALRFNPLDTTVRKMLPPLVAQAGRVLKVSDDGLGIELGVTEGDISGVAADAAAAIAAADTAVNASAEASAFATAAATSEANAEISATNAAADGASAGAAAGAAAVATHAALTTSVHGIPDTAALATKAGAETLTNKTIGDSLTFTQISTPTNPGAGALKTYAKADGKLYTLDPSGVEKAIGSGSGGGINWISGNPDFEAALTGWTTYNDAAGVAPVDGTGGSPLATLTRTLTNPLEGVASALFTKGASNRQGDGFAYDFSVNRANRGKIQAVSFNYEIISGTYADNDLSVWVINRVSGRVIPVASISNIAVVGGGIFYGTFATDIDSADYRLVVHVQSTSALAYSVSFDSFSVGPQTKSTGPVITEWRAYTPTGYWTSNATYTGAWRRVAEDIELKINIDVTGTPAPSADFVMTPAQMLNGLGLSVDFNSPKFLLGANASAKTHVGNAVITDTSAANFASMGVFYQKNTSSFSIGGAGTSANVSNITATSPMTFAAGDSVSMTVKLPIAGWGGSNIVSSDAPTGPVVARILGSTPAATANNPLIFPTVAEDTIGGYDAGTGLYRVKVADWYQVVSLVDPGTLAAGNSIFISVNGNTTPGSQGRIQGLAISQANFPALVTGLVKCNVNDTISIRPTANTGTGGAASYFHISRVNPSAQQIAQAESVFVRAAGTSGSNAINSATPITVVYTTKTSDLFALYNNTTGVLTANRPMKVRVKACIAASTGASSVNSGVNLFLYKNGAQISMLGSFIFQAANSFFFQIGGEDTIELLPNDTLEIRANKDAAVTSFNINASQVFSYMTLTSVA